MASMTIIMSLFAKSAHTGAVVGKTWSSKVFRPNSLRPNSQGVRYESSVSRSQDAAKQSVGEAKRAGQELKNEAASAAQNVSQNAKEIVGQAANSTQNMTEKAKQTAQDAWDSVKDKTQRIKETVVGKAEDTKDTVKENAQNVTRSMNTKN